MMDLATEKKTTDSPAPIPETLWFSCDGMMVINERRQILAVNPALEQMTGWPSDALVGKAECGVLFSCRDLHGCSLTERPWECPGLKAIQQFEPVHSAEYAIRSADHKRKVVSTSYTPIQLPERPVWALAVMRDVTLQKRRERQLIHKAMTDPLTHLPNRAAFLEAFLKEAKRAARHNRSLAVAMADIDQFKTYNDAHGHLAGDELLMGLAGLLKTGRRGADIVARYGGDEFAFLLPETDAVGAMVVTERIRFAIEKFPFVGTRVTISIGVASFPGDGSTVQELLESADRRLYQAKRLGCNQVVGPGGR